MEVYGPHAPHATPLTQTTSGWASPVYRVDGAVSVQQFRLSAGETGAIRRQDHHITINKSDNVSLHAYHEGVPLGTKRVASHTFHLRPAYATHDSQWDLPCELTVIALNPRFVQQCAHQLTGQPNTTVSFEPLIVRSDQFLLTLAQRLEESLLHQRYPPRYCKQLTTSLAMHLVAEYGELRPSGEAAALTPNTVHKLDRYIRDHLGEVVLLEELAAVAGLSRYYLSRTFKQTTGWSPSQYILKVRMETAQRDILDTGQSLGEIAYQVGYSSPAHFSRAYRRFFGRSPSSLRP